MKVKPIHIIIFLVGILIGIALSGIVRGLARNSEYTGLRLPHDCHVSSHVLHIANPDLSDKIYV